MGSIQDRFYRNDDTTWSYILNKQESDQTERTNESSAEPGIKEVRLNIGKISDDGSHVYELASTITTVFEQSTQKINRELFNQGFEVEIIKEDSKHPAAGKWLVQAAKAKKTWSDIFKSFIPFFSSIEPKEIIKVEVSKIEESAWKKVQSLFTSRTSCSSTPQEAIIFKAPANEYFSSLTSRLSKECFLDPFTRLATDCLTTVEPYFVMEAEHRGSWRFVLNDETQELTLQKIPASSSEATEQEKEKIKEENRQVIRFYREFLEEEYGPWFIDLIATNYNLDFKTMIEKGDPLYPDHVSKCNIGVQNIEIRHIEALYRKLEALHTRLFIDLNPETNPLSLEETFAKMSQHPTNKELSLSLREIRGLLNATRRHIHENQSEPNASTFEITLKDIKQYLDTFISDVDCEDIKEAKHTYFNEVVDMIMSSESELERSFTGRKIRHLSIMGFHTMGDKNVSNPCRDMFELLHVFSDLQKTEDWNNFYEILGHVVAKKSLFRKTAVQNSENSSEKDIAWHVGLLLPGPRTKKNEKRWLCNTEFVDSGDGNVNYTFKLVSRNESDAQNPHVSPMIKLYRSTASNRNAINWQDSLQADLNPKGSPGALNPELTYEYERKSFDERTIPLWVAYTLAASKLMSDIEKLQNDQTLSIVFKEKIFDYMKRAVADLTVYFDRNRPDDKESFLPHINLALEKKDFQELRKYFFYLAQEYRERPIDKKAENIAFVGHSLGGALAQFGLCYFGTRVNRIPLPGHNFVCYSSDGPGIDTSHDEVFIKFLKENRELLEILGQKWKIFHQFEYGDFVPQSGSSHVGTNGYSDELKSVLDFRARVFRPMQTAKSIAMTTAPTHGRRIGLAEPGVDYTTTPLNPREVYTFDHAKWLGNLSKVFGFTVLVSPYLTETVRLQASKILYPFNRVIDAFVGNSVGYRDKNGVFYIADRGNAV